MTLEMDKNGPNYFPGQSCLFKKLKCDDSVHVTTATSLLQVQRRVPLSSSMALKHLG